jgi:AmiR/NasT family two-component response regulator
MSMPTLLAIVDTDADTLPAWLAQAGLPAAALGTLATLSHQLGALAPQQVVCHLQRDVPALAQWLAEQPGPLPAPISLLTSRPDAATLVALTAAGLHAWADVAATPTPNAPSAALNLPLLLQLAHARWQREHQTQTELARVREQLDERKWVERAKGVLMSARVGGAHMGEDEAFRLLRGAAMHANLRVGEVSRSVIESAQWADAINRAGQLRMLSQRLVKLAAQRLLGVDARRARTLQHQASRRAQDNLDHLAHLAPLQKNQPANPAVLLNALAGATQAWATLKEALEARQTAAALLGTDAQAEALLQAAETLTDALETHGARRALHIINLCGRQRMRCQRLAKEALLATLPGQEARALRLGTLLDDFEAALLELERAPLSTPDTRTMLAQARDEWLRLLRGLRSTEGDEGRAALAGSADALLDLFDQLTNAYEHSLQVLMA